MSFVIKDANYDEYIKYNGLKMVDTADAEDVKNGKSKYFIVMEDDKYYTAFSLYECNDNEINLNTIPRFVELLGAIINHLKERYDVIKIRFINFYNFNIEKEFNVIKTVVVNKKLDLKDYYIKTS